jgi:cobalt-zinc-cadmium efflux system protein
VTTRTTRLLVALGVNVVLVVGQVVAGVVAHSTGLLADAGHNLTDVAALGTSVAAVRWATRPRSAARSFGNHRGTIIAALFNSAVLGMVTVAIVVVSIIRLLHPPHVHGTTVVIVAACALIINALAALVLHEDSNDLNMRVAFWHMLSDVLGSLCVLIGGAVIALSGAGWDRVDPVASILVALLIIRQSFRLTKASVDVLLESTPSDVDLEALREAMTDVSGVGEVHDLHVWSLSSDVRALSAHLVMEGHPSLEEAQMVGSAVRQRISGDFDLAHTTFELECERCIDEDVDPCEMDGTPMNRARGH